MKGQERVKKDPRVDPRSLSASRSAGISLIEVLITMTIFVILVGGIYFSYANLIEVISRTRLRTLAVSLLTKEIEVIRNLKYDDVGIAGGAPAGVILAERTVNFESQNFIIKAAVRNIDDPFDGVAGGSPNDTAPADHKLVQLEVDCPNCPYSFKPITFTTWVSPQNLESSTQNGSLFVNVFDANGESVAGATVKVENSTTSPAISITDTTNNSGTLQLVDIPTSTNAYEITITKSGYSSAKTYPLGGSGNPNPLQPHATVASQQITEISFAIDRVSTINVKTQDYYCQGIGSIDFDYEGVKLIGSDPDVLKTTGSFTTDTNGLKTLSSIEWDTFNFINTDGSYYLTGAIAPLPVKIDPNKTYDLALNMESATTTALLVTVSASSGLAISDADVNIKKTGTDITKLTGRQIFTATDWSGNNYTAQDGNIETANPAGELRLIQINGQYPTSTNSYLESKTIDFGTATTTFHSIEWLPLSQPSQTTLQFQIASNNDNSTWSYFGPDGTGNTYFTATSTLGTVHNNKRYVRYKAYLNTTDVSATPSLKDLSLGFSSGCAAAGSAYFAGISTGTYTATVSKTGYTTATSSISVSSGWQELKLMLQ